MPAIPTSLLILASLAMLVRVGTALAATGLARAKNAAAAVLRSAIEIAAATLGFWAIGAAILLAGQGRFFGIAPRQILLMDVPPDSISLAWLYFHLVLVLIACAPLAMALQERAKLMPIVLGGAVLGGLVVPMAALWAWSGGGWLRRLGFADAAGAGVLHVAGGVFALVATLFVGPRSGKYNADRSANLLPGHNLPLAAGGILLAWAAWAPYVAGASLMHGLRPPLAAINVLLAGSAALVVGYATSRMRYGKPDILLSLGALYGGLVAIAAAGGAVSPAAAVAIGAVAGVIVPWFSVRMEMRHRIDDAGGLVAPSIAGGAWGLVAAGVFATAPLGERLRLVGVQCVGLLAMAALSLTYAIVLYAIARKLTSLRLSEADEYDGCDLAEHDVNAYPDFQQNMIKSYHLREA